MLIVDIDGNATIQNVKAALEVEFVDVFFKTSIRVQGHVLFGTYPFCLFQEKKGVCGVGAVPAAPSARRLTVASCELRGYGGRQDEGLAYQ